MVAGTSHRRRHLPFSTRSGPPEGVCELRESPWVHGRPAGTAQVNKGLVSMPTVTDRRWLHVDACGFPKFERGESK